MELSIIARWGHNVLLVAFALLTIVTCATFLK
jgi:hypothetical protein